MEGSKQGIAASHQTGEVVSPGRGQRVQIEFFGAGEVALQQVRISQAKESDYYQIFELVYLSCVQGLSAVLLGKGGISGGVRTHCQLQLGVRLLLNVACQPGNLDG